MEHKHTFKSYAQRSVCMNSYKPPPPPPPPPPAPPPMQNIQVMNE
jgi:hypothetical protein